MLANLNNDEWVYSIVERENKTMLCEGIIVNNKY